LGRKKVAKFATFRGGVGVIVLLKMLLWGGLWRKMNIWKGRIFRLSLRRRSGFFRQGYRQISDRITGFAGLTG
jgi:hypothetical protein